MEKIKDGFTLKDLWEVIPTTNNWLTISFPFVFFFVADNESIQLINYKYFFFCSFFVIKIQNKWNTMLFVTKHMRLDENHLSNRDDAIYLKSKLNL